MVPIVSLARAISFLDAWKLKASRSMRDSSCSRRFVFQKFIAVGCGLQNLPCRLGFVARKSLGASRYRKLKAFFIYAKNQFFRFLDYNF